MLAFGSFFSTLLAAFQKAFSDGIIAWITQLLSGLFPTS